MKKKYFFFLTPTLFIFLVVLFLKLTPLVSDIESCSFELKDKQDFLRRNSCLESTVSDLLKFYSIKEILSYFSSEDISEDMKSSCHSVAHEIGRQSYKKDNNLEKTLSECSSSCGSGCKHGALEEAFKNDLGIIETDSISIFPKKQIIEIGEKYCINDTKTLCHAVGHIFFRYTGNITASLLFCDSMNYKEKCYQGAFMEFFGGIDALSSKPYLETDKEYMYTCSEVVSKYRHACYFVAVKADLQIFTIKNIETSPKSALARCRSLLVKEEQAYCVESLASLGDNFIKNCTELDSSEERNACSFGKEWFISN